MLIRCSVKNRISKTIYLFFVLNDIYNRSFTNDLTAYYNGSDSYSMIKQINDCHYLSEFSLCESSYNLLFVNSYHKNNSEEL